LLTIFEAHKIAWAGKKTLRKKHKSLLGIVGDPKNIVEEKSPRIRIDRTP